MMKIFRGADVIAKSCKRCGFIKLTHLYGKHKKSIDRLDYWCLKCRVDYNRTLYYKRKAGIPPRQKLPDDVLKRNKRRGIFKCYLLRKYGITIEEYEGKFRKQLGRCAICGEQNLDGKRLCTDHHHKTGTVRDLLCDRCNTILGMSEEDMSLLEKMKDYVEKWQRIIWKRSSAQAS